MEQVPKCAFGGLRNKIRLEVGLFVFEERSQTEDYGGNNISKLLVSQQQIFSPAALGDSSYSYSLRHRISLCTLFTDHLIKHPHLHFLVVEQICSFV